MKTTNGIVVTQWEKITQWWELENTTCILSLMWTICTSSLRDTTDTGRKNSLCREQSPAQKCWKRLAEVWVLLRKQNGVYENWCGNIMFHPVANDKVFYSSGNVALETPLETCCCLLRKSLWICERACVYVCVITSTASNGYHTSRVLSPLLIEAQMCQKLWSRGNSSKAEWEQLILHVYPIFSAVISCRNAAYHQL